VDRRSRHRAAGGVRRAAEAAGPTASMQGVCGTVLISCQEGLLPGRDFAEKLHNAEAYGFDAVELSGGALDDEAGFAERRRALAGSRVRASSICGGVHNRFIDVEPAEREKARDSLRRRLHQAAELRCVGGPIFVPIFSSNNRMPDLRPWQSRWDLSRALCVEMLRQIDADAREAGATALIEPLNRYEANFLNRLEQAAGMLRELPQPCSIRVMADFFHMHIEEAHTAAAIEAAGDWIGHVHLADGTRKEPGSASIDFVAGFRALAKIGFKGAMAFECGLSGPREQALPKSVAYLRRCLAEAGAA
jgi:sugar phosphate isomerase/epimerase